MRDGHDRPRRGADPHPGRRAGRADHDPVREDAADPRARHGGAGAPRASTSSPPPTTATAASTSCPVALRRRFNTVRAAAAGQRRGRGRHRRAAASTALGRGAGAARRCRRRRRRSAGWSRSSASCAPASPTTAGPSSSRPSGTLSHRRGDLGGDQRPRAGRALRRRRAARRPTWPPAWSARSSRTRCRTRSSGGSTSRRWSGSAPGWADFYRACREARVTAAAVTDRRSQVLGIRHHGPGLGPRRVRARRSSALRPDVVLHRGPARGRRAARAGRRRRTCVPPVALLAYAAGRPARAAAFWPFAVFSPGVAGARAGRCDHGVPGRASATCPRGSQLAWPRAADAPRTARRAGRGDRARPRATRSARWPPRPGYDDPERWWDDVVEHRRDGARRSRRSTEAMAARARATRPDAADAVARRGARRTCARRSCGPRCEDGRERVAVVCGAWHAPALAGPLPPAAADARAAARAAQGARSR